MRLYNEAPSILRDIKNQLQNPRNDTADRGTKKGQSLGTSVPLLAQIFLVLYAMRADGGVHGQPPDRQRNLHGVRTVTQGNIETTHISNESEEHVREIAVSRRGPGRGRTEDMAQEVHSDVELALLDA